MVWAWPKNIFSLVAPKIRGQCLWMTLGVKYEKKRWNNNSLVNQLKIYLEINKQSRANLVILPHHLRILCQIDGSRAIFSMRILFNCRTPREIAKICVVVGSHITWVLDSSINSPEKFDLSLFKNLYKNANILIVKYIVIHSFYDHIFIEIRIFYFTSK